MSENSIAFHRSKNVNDLRTITNAHESSFDIVRQTDFDRRSRKPRSAAELIEGLILEIAVSSWKCRIT